MPLPNWSSHNSTVPPKKRGKKRKWPDTTHKPYKRGRKRVAISLPDPNALPSWPKSSRTIWEGIRNQYKGQQQGALLLSSEDREMRRAEEGQRVQRTLLLRDIQSDYQVSKYEETLKELETARNQMESREREEEEEEKARSARRGHFSLNRVIKVEREDSPPVVQEHETIDLTEDDVHVNFPSSSTRSKEVRNEGQGAPTPLFSIDRKRDPQGWYHRPREPPRARPNTSFIRRDMDAHSLDPESRIKREREEGQRVMRKDFRSIIQEEVIDFDLTRGNVVDINRRRDRDASLREREEGGRVKRVDFREIEETGGRRDAGQNHTERKDEGKILRDPLNKTAFQPSSSSKGKHKRKGLRHKAPKSKDRHFYEWLPPSSDTLDPKPRRSGPGVGYQGEASANDVGLSEWRWPTSHEQRTSRPQRTSTFVPQTSLIKIEESSNSSGSSESDSAEPDIKPDIGRGNARSLTPETRPCVKRTPNLYKGEGPQLTKLSTSGTAQTTTTQDKNRQEKPLSSSTSARSHTFSAAFSGIGSGLQSQSSYRPSFSVRGGVGVRPTRPPGPTIKTEIYGARGPGFGPRPYFPPRQGYPQAQNGRYGGSQRDFRLGGLHLQQPPSRQDQNTEISEGLKRHNDIRTWNPSVSLYAMQSGNEYTGTGNQNYPNPNRMPIFPRPQSQANQPFPHFRPTSHPSAFKYNQGMMFSQNHQYSQIQSPLKNMRDGGLLGGQLNWNSGFLPGFAQMNQVQVQRQMQMRNFSSLPFDTSSRSWENMTSLKEQEEDEEFPLVNASPKDSNDSFQFSIMCYNVLAPTLQEDHRYLYKDCDPASLTWANRKKCFFKEVESLKPDIICLQEVDSYYLQDYVSHFKSIGYQGIFKKRTNEKVDGCAIFFLDRKFQLLDSIGVEYYQRSNVALLDRDNIALLAKFATKTDGKGESQQCRFVVATTHLLFNQKRTDVKIGQAKLLLAELDRLACSEIDEKGNAKYLPTIITGDFNVDPNNTVSNFIRRGKLSITDHSSERELKTIPTRLGISDQCQHYQLVHKRVLSLRESNTAEACIESHSSDSALHVHLSSTGPHPHGHTTHLTTTTFSNSNENFNDSDAENIQVEISQSVQTRKQLWVSSSGGSSGLGRSPITHGRNKSQNHPEDWILTEIKDNSPQSSCTFSTGQLSHSFNFKDVYGPTSQEDEIEDGVECFVTTKQRNWVRVDYIYYSTNFNKHMQRKEEGELKLIRRLRLPTRGEMGSSGISIPCRGVSSDHFPLVAEFSITPKPSPK